MGHQAGAVTAVPDQHQKPVFHLSSEGKHFLVPPLLSLQASGVVHQPEWFLPPLKGRLSWSLEEALQYPECDGVERAGNCFRNWGDLSRTATGFFWTSQRMCPAYLGILV